MTAVQQAWGEGRAHSNIGMLKLSTRRVGGADSYNDPHRRWDGARGVHLPGGKALRGPGAGRLWCYAASCWRRAEPGRRRWASAAGPHRQLSPRPGRRCRQWRCRCSTRPRQKRGGRPAPQAGTCMHGGRGDVHRVGRRRSVPHLDRSPHARVPPPSTAPAASHARAEPLRQASIGLEAAIGAAVVGAGVGSRRAIRPAAGAGAGAQGAGAAAIQRGGGQEPRGKSTSGCVLALQWDRAR